MKTSLPEKINTVAEAKLLLSNLHNNGEGFHPEDDAFNTGCFTAAEAQQLNQLMEDIYNLEQVKSELWDPCAYCILLLHGVASSFSLTATDNERLTALYISEDLDVLESRLAYLRDEDNWTEADMQHNEKNIKAIETAIEFKQKYG